MFEQIHRSGTNSRFHRGSVLFHRMILKDEDEALETGGISQFDLRLNVR